MRKKGGLWGTPDIKIEIKVRGETKKTICMGGKRKTGECGLPAERDLLADRPTKHEIEQVTGGNEQGKSLEKGGVFTNSMKTERRERIRRRQKNFNGGGQKTEGQLIIRQKFGLGHKQGL